MNGSNAPHIASGLLHSQAPVIVTFDGDAVVDTFGDLAYFTQAQDSEDLLRLLRDLLVGHDGDTAPLLRAVELSPGKYADVHVVPEGELRHLVLLDATAGVLEARELQQTKNEASLAGHQLKRELIVKDQEHRDELRRHREKEQSLRHRLDMLERISDDVRARLGALVGHARVLVPNCTDDPGAMRTLGQIQHTAVYLEAQLLNYAEYLRSRSQPAGPAVPEPIALKFLAGELERLFGLREEDGLSIEVVSEAGLGAAVEMDYPRVYQLLITLIALAFDSVSRRRVAVRLDAPGGDLLIGLDARVDWDIEALAGGAGPLDGLQAGDAAVQFGLQACRRLVQSMDGQFGIGTDEDDPGLTRIRILLPQPASRQGSRSAASTGRRAMVAIDDPRLAANVTSLLLEIGLEPQVVDALAAFEMAARASDTGLVVLSDSFAGESGAGLVYRLHDLGARAPVVLLSHQQASAVSSGWQRKGHRVVVAADAGREVLAAALRDAAENGAVD